MPASPIESSTPLETPTIPDAPKRLFVIRILALAAIAVTTAMMIDEFVPSAPFCGTDGDCQAVTHTAFGRPLGIPLSLVGWTTFIGFYIVGLSSRMSARKVLGTMSLAAGITGIGLLCIQRVVLQQMCPMCVMVDSIAILIATVESFWPVTRSPLTPVSPVKWTGAAVAACLAPVAWFALQPPTVAPDYVRARWQNGKVNVVEVLDFACVYCRESHPVVLSALTEAGVDVNFVRIPLAFDPEEPSREAAKLYFAAERAGRQEQLANQMMEGENLKSVNLTDAASRAGLTKEQIDDAMKAPASEQTIEAAHIGFHTAGHPGLPQIWVGDTLLRGAVPKEVLVKAIRAAKPGERIDAIVTDAGQQN